MKIMKTYDLRFRSRADLEQAFATVISCELVVDCLVTCSSLSLRFRAPAGRKTERIFERLREDEHVLVSSTTPQDRPAIPWWESPQPGRNWG
jgi:hypothetical protein